MEELIGLVKAQALTFEAMVAKLTAAGVAAAREAAAFVLLIVGGKVPADAANAPVAVADLEAIGAKSWADELTAAGTESLTLNAPAEVEIPKILEALKAAPAEGGEEKPPAQAPPAASEASSPGEAQSKTVTKTETVKVEFTRDGKSETVVLGRADVLLAERDELVRLRKEQLENKIALLARSNKDGYGFPPVVVEMTRAFLARKENEPVKLTKDVTEPDASAAFLRVLTEVRDRGLVKLSEQAATESKPGGKGKVVEGLEYGPDNVPEAVMARYKAQHGETVTAEDVCIAELMLALQKVDPKLDISEAKRKAERAVAAVTSPQES